MATGEVLDGEMRLRTEEHGEGRHPGWRTIEAPIGVGRRIQEEFGDAQVVILDCLTLLVSNVIGHCGGDAEQVDPKLVEDRLALEIKELVECIDGWLAHYNLFRPHEGLGGKTPAEAAGIEAPFKSWKDVVEGDDSAK